jgi:hypothetical protein
MERHETACTANPKRECHICKGDPQTGAAELPVLIAFCKERAAKSQDGLTISKADLEDLRALCDGCPACMLAAIRQGGVYSNDFDARLEFKSFWDSWRSEQASEFAAAVGYGI